jgi:hypothetical protein
MGDQARRYTEPELSLIIQAALDLEKRSRIEASGGLSLAEIEEIARETGISAEHIRLAVEGLAGQGKKSRSRLLLGGETSIRRTEVLPEELTQAELDRLEASLPALTGQAEGRVAGGGSLTWKRGILKTILDGFPLSLRVDRAEGGTRIEATARLGSMAAVLFAAAGGAGVLVGFKLSILALILVGLGSLPLPTSALVIALGGLVGGGGFWLLARLGFRAFVKRSRERVEGLVARIRAAIKEMRS